MPDGLYRVQFHHICAGFIVKDGQVFECAPVLRRWFDYWSQRAERIS